MAVLATKGGVDYPIDIDDHRNGERDPQDRACELYIADLNSRNMTIYWLY